jgi:cytochrome oxidase Cu insertion factor (SCO1/SenC/PrrC family)
VKRLKIVALVAAVCVATQLAAAAARAEIPVLDRVRVLAAPRMIGNAELMDQDGAPFDLEALHGKVTFVLFGFTNCPDVCPLAMERLRALNDAKTLEAHDVQYVLISVDGERDTPAALKKFLAKYSGEFVGLTAPAARVKPIAAQFSASFFMGEHHHDGGYDVAHSPQIFVLDAQGQLRAELYGSSIEAMTAVAKALAAEAR